MSLNSTTSVDSDITLADITLARAQVTAIGKLENRDEQDLLDCSVGDMLLMAKAYRDAAAPADLTTWDTFLKVMGYFAQVATPLASVAGAFAGVFNVAAAAKSA